MKTRRSFTLKSIIFKTKHFSQFWGHTCDILSTQWVPPKKDDALMWTAFLFAHQVFISTRHGSWVMSRISEDGYPWDSVYHTRFKTMLRNAVPQIVVKWMMEIRMNQWFDHENYGLIPQNKWVTLLFYGILIDNQGCQKGFSLKRARSLTWQFRPQPNSVGTI